MFLMETFCNNIDKYALYLFEMFHFVGFSRYSAVTSLHDLINKAYLIFPQISPAERTCPDMWRSFSGRGVTNKRWDWQTNRRTDRRTRHQSSPPLRPPRVIASLCFLRTLLIWIPPSLGGILCVVFVRFINLWLFLPHSFFLPLFSRIIIGHHKIVLWS